MNLKFNLAATLLTFTLASTCAAMPEVQVVAATVRNDEMSEIFGEYARVICKTAFLVVCLAGSYYDAATQDNNTVRKYVQSFFFLYNFSRLHSHIKALRLLNERWRNLYNESQHHH